MIEKARRKPRAGDMLKYSLESSIFGQLVVIHDVSERYVIYEIFDLQNGTSRMHTAESEMHVENLEAWSGWDIVE